MALLHPSWLWALSALAIPIYLHLFHLQRYKRLDFPNVRFLQLAAQRAQAMHKVQHWAVLVVRCLGIMGLVLAFCQPYLPGPSGAATTGQRALSVFVDDSYSMDGQNPQGRLLDQARKGAQEAVLSTSAADRFQLITAKANGQQQLLLSQEEALDAATQVQSGPYGASLGRVLQRQREALSRSTASAKRAILFTDLQRTTTDVENWTDNAEIPTLIVPLTPASSDNLALDSVWFQDPLRRVGAAEKLHLRIRNHGTTRRENVPMELLLDGQRRAVGTLSVSAGAAVDTALVFTHEKSGWRRGEVRITDGSVAFDDRLPLAFVVAERLNVLQIEGEAQQANQAVGAVFSMDSAYAYRASPYRSLDLGDLRGTDLVVLNGPAEVSSGLVSALLEFVENGGSLAFFPAEGVPSGQYAQLLAALGASTLGEVDTTSTRVERMDLQQPFFRDVFTQLPRNVQLPTVRYRYALRTQAGATTLLRMLNGSPFLSMHRVGKGTVYLCAAPLTDVGGTFTAHALFVTSLLRMAELSRPLEPLYSMLGALQPLVLHNAAPFTNATLQLVNAQGARYTPTCKPTPTGTVVQLDELEMEAGIYAAVQAKDTLAWIALAQPRSESDLRSYAAEELKETLAARGLSTFALAPNGVEQLSVSLATLDQGTPLWTWFVWCALICLVIETLLLRWRS
jgi:Aerotolerance regulator N-terminal